VHVWWRKEKPTDLRTKIGRLGQIDRGGKPGGGSGGERGANAIWLMLEQLRTRIGIVASLRLSSVWEGRKEHARGD
jgi:hypothetical protein